MTVATASSLADLSGNTVAPTAWNDFSFSSPESPTRRHMAEDNRNHGAQPRANPFTQRRHRALDGKWLSKCVISSVGLYMDVVVSTVLQLHPQLLVAVLNRFLDPDLPDTTTTIPTPLRTPGAPLDVWRCPPVQISLPNSGHTQNRPTHKNQREHGFHGDLLVTVHINQLEFHFRRNPKIQLGAPVAVKSPSLGYTKFSFARPRTKNAMLLDCSRI